MVIRLSWLSGRALAAQARGVLGSTPATASLFTFPYFCPIGSKISLFHYCPPKLCTTVVLLGIIIASNQYTCLQILVSYIWKRWVTTYFYFEFVKHFQWAELTNRGTKPIICLTEWTVHKQMLRILVTVLGQCRKSFTVCSNCVCLIKPLLKVYLWEHKQFFLLGAFWLHNCFLPVRGTFQLKLFYALVYTCKCVYSVPSFPGLPTIQFLITCSMQQWRGNAWSILLCDVSVYIGRWEAGGSPSRKNTCWHAFFVLNKERYVFHFVNIRNSIQRLVQELQEKVSGSFYFQSRTQPPLLST